MMILRPHHGMCINFFTGMGYSSEFTEHMNKMINKLNNENPQIIISVCADVICEACPNNTDGLCDSEEKVLRYDNKVLEACGMKDGDRIYYRDFISLVYEKIILSGKREQICGNCQWNEVCR